MRHRMLAAAGISALALALAQPAGAHVTIGFQANAVQRLAVSAPVEPPRNTTKVIPLEKRHNVKLKLYFPEGFKVVSCKKTSDFRCKKTGRTITWIRRGGSDNLQSRDVFYYKVRTPKNEGLYDVVAHQFYSDGDVVKWDEHTPAFGEPGYGTEPEHPAPQIRVRART